MRIGQAIEELEKGLKIYRKGWNGKNQYLELKIPIDKSGITLPYVFIKTVQGDCVPWFCSQSDLLADDWDIV